MLSNLDNLDINQEAAIELLLKERYLSEFQNINGTSEHPLGLNFYEWLGKKKLISPYKLSLILVELNEQKEEPKEK